MAYLVFPSLLANLCGMAVVLVGSRGSGKTTVARILAEKLGWGIVDTDQNLVEKAGRSIREIFEHDGDSHFRDLETQSLRYALGFERHIVSTGGGIIVREENRLLLRSSQKPVIYLMCSPEELLMRIRGDHNTNANRPNLTALGGGIEEVRHLLVIRDPLYREVASQVVDVTARSAESAACEILKIVQG